MTIYALSTPPGVSGIAIIRLSGTNALRIAKDFVGTINKPRMAILKKIIDSKHEMIDEGIVIWYPKAHLEFDLTSFYIILFFLDSFSIFTMVTFSAPFG